jgi:hypothetical protein
MADFQSMASPHIEALLEPGEALRGVAAATRTSMFKGQMVALAATDRRLIVLPLSRKFTPSGPPIFVTTDTLAAVEAGDRWYELTANAQLRMRLTDGTKLRLMMMPGGEGPLGRLAGGPGQKAGFAAIADWFRKAAL